MTRAHVSSRRGLIVFPALAVVVSVSCTTASPASSTNDAPVGSERITTLTTVAPKGSAARTVARVVAGVRIARERPAGYSRSLFRHWTDDDGNGCSAREDVLIAESLTPAQVDAYGCKVIAGDWYSSYDGLTHTDPADLDIDHVVALKEAWDSGAHSWTAARRRAFANDLSDARSLIAVTASVNRSKGDKDPSNWMPPNRGDWCRYIADWVAVKARWGLTMDESEHGRISRLARGECASTTVLGWGRGVETRPSDGGPTPTTSPGVIATPSTSPPVTSPSDTTGSGVLPEVKPVRCGKAQIGDLGTYRGKTYVCSTTRLDGTPYAPGYSMWRPVG